MYLTSYLMSLLIALIRVFQLSFILTEENSINRLSIELPH